jgi:hypothetical protein
VSPTRSRTVGYSRGIGAKPTVYLALMVASLEG